MKFTDGTMKILKNFADINCGMVIRKTPDSAEKSIIRTIEINGKIYGEVEVEERFPTNICIAEFHKLINLVENLEEYDIEFTDTCVIVTSGDSTIKLTYTDPECIIHPPTSFKNESSTIHFDLKQDEFEKVLNTSSILGLEHIKIFSKDGGVFIQALNARNPNSSTYDIELGKYDGEDFEVFIKRECVGRIMKGDYSVSIDASKFATFKNMVNTSLVYFTPLEKIST